ncbi:Protein SirB1, N-terminal [Cinara cedri]|uniref:Protein SirB1, N-terminal n=1 Tax=Cinara cedri TaxID=506608 RepID=A0A5E4N1N9_9HEMI|nr:Protein SirB1, N-terminal [Cinara cedri]
MNQDGSTQIKQQHEITTIVDLPTELIVNICSFRIIRLTDIFNLATCHSKLNNSLFHEQNSVFWKSKYIQKFGPLHKNEFEINIDEQNTWKNEITLRASLNKTVSYEIEQMPGKYLRYKSVPFHLFPFTEQLHSKYQSHRFYVSSAAMAYYRRLLSNKCCNANYDLLYMAHLFLIYSSQVYFGYKLQEYISSPITENLIEHAFYLLGRWLCPTDDTSYWDMNSRFNGIAVKVCETMQENHPLHPIVGKESDLDQLHKRGQNVIDHDLFDATSTICLLSCLQEVLFANRNIVCMCDRDVNCFLMPKAVERQKGSVFILCIIYESVARRLGVKVTLTKTPVDHCVTWLSSWPGDIHKDPLYFMIDITRCGIMLPSEICPISKSLAGCDDLNSILDMFWSFSKTMKNMESYKFVLDLQRILKPENFKLQFRYEQFHNDYDYCQCPMLRDSVNPHAPNHTDMKDTMYTDWKNIFPLIPQTRGTNDDPKYAIGMMIDTIAVGIGGIGSRSSGVRNKLGIIVGWTRVLNTNPSPKKAVYLYHVLIGPVCCLRTGKYQNPIIKSLMTNKHEKLKRQLELYDYNFKNTGKFFKHYSYDLCAFVPVNDLAKLYPDDHSFTVNKSRKFKNKLKLSNFVPKF